MPTQQPKTAPTRADEKKPSIKSRLIKWTLILLAVLLAAFFGYRWVGTYTYRGTVQRVYERGAEYRIEFAPLKGKVLVAANKDLNFPYLKRDSADLHAELNKLSTTKDVVDLRVWGLRLPFFSVFPNVVDAAFVATNKQRLEQRAERLTEVALDTLNKEGALKPGHGVHEALSTALAKELKAPEKVKKEKKPQEGSSEE